MSIYNHSILIIYISIILLFKVRFIMYIGMYIHVYTMCANSTHCIHVL